MKKIGIIVLLFFASICSAQFVVQSTPVSDIFQSVSASSNSCAWACGYRGILVRTTNGGNNWMMANGNIPSARYMFDIWAIDSLIALTIASNASPDNAYIYKTTNGGINWTQTFFQSAGFINAISFINSSTGFVTGDPVGGRWSLFRTTDAGNTWDSTGLRLTALGSETGIDNSLYYEGSKVWFGTSTGKIYYSSNSGANWTSSQTPLISVAKIYFNDANSGVGFAGAEYTPNNIKLARTTNGSAWEDGGDIENTNVRGFCGIKGTSIFWMAHEYTIYASTNSGANWTLAFTLPVNFFTNISTSRSGEYPRTIYACTGDGKIVAGNTNTIGIKLISNEVPEKFELEQNFPNPFNPLTKIIFKIAEKSFIILKIYDLNGKELSTLVNNSLTPGTYSAEFNAAVLASGAYFYSISNGKLTQTKKMLVVK